MPLPRSIRAFRLRPGSPVALRLQHWLGHLSAYSASLDPIRDPVEGIHQLRLVAKSLRAVIRLADGGRPAKDLILRDRAIGRLAARVGVSRDSQVHSELLLKLARKEGAPVLAAVGLLIRRHAVRNSSSGAASKVIGGLTGEADALQRLLPARVDPGSIGKAVWRSYRKTLGWRERAVEESVPTDFHAWRRWQKRLEAQLRLVGVDDANDPGRLWSDLHELQEDLGTLHDVDELADRLGAEAQWKGIHPRIRRRLLKLLDQRQRELRRRLVRGSRKVLGTRLRQCCRATAKAWEKAAQTP